MHSKILLSATTKWWQQWDGIFYIPQEIPSDKKPNINQTYLHLESVKKTIFNKSSSDKKPNINQT